MTTIQTVTDEQIATLRSEAAAAGDDAQVRICDRALDGDDSARAECVRVICEAGAVLVTDHTGGPVGATPRVAVELRRRGELPRR